MLFFESPGSSSLLVISASHLQTLKVTKCYLKKLQPIVVSNGRGGHGKRHVLHKNSVSELLQVERGCACDHVTKRQVVFLGLAIPRYPS